ncbi:Hypothetical Protein OBI_RACECAR_37 [Arthrobacter phage Racecar]|nr:hypothetical protein PBI_RACECAR_118 [Arthrobacter phage Racecar]QFG12793.1 hypothetical protein PBI_MIMI_115 [Arthrobacter phage Mimi]
MNVKLIRNIVDMTRFASSGVEFSQVYGFDNGTKMVVSRNSMIRGAKAGFMGVLPYDKAGNQIDERAEHWLSAEEVAEKMAILAEE